MIKLENTQLLQKIAKALDYTKLTYSITLNKFNILTPTSTYLISFEELINEIEVLVSENKFDPELYNIIYTFNKRGYGQLLLTTITDALAEFELHDKYSAIFIADKYIHINLINNPNIKVLYHDQYDLVRLDIICLLKERQ